MEPSREVEVAGYKMGSSHTRVLLGASFAATFLSATPVLAKITSVTLSVVPLIYAGACPATISFTAIVVGDPGTVFGHEFIGDGAPPTKKLYGYIEPAGDLIVTSNLSVDAAHAGTFYRQVRISVYQRSVSGAMALVDTLESDKTSYTVKCVDPGTAPSPSPGANR